MRDGYGVHWVVQNAGVKLTAETQVGRLLPAAAGDGGRRYFVLRTLCGPKYESEVEESVPVKLRCF